MNPPDISVLNRLMIDPRSGSPLHLQVRRMMQLAIEQNFENEQMFWTEFALTDYLKLSRVTVRRALDDLAREGLLRRQAAIGTFVRKPDLNACSITTVGVFVSQYDSDFLSGMLEQIDIACRTHSLRMRVYNTHKGDNTADAFRLVEGNAKDEAHILMTDGVTTQELYRTLTDRGYRTVSIDTPSSGYQGAYVATDAAMAVDIGLAHLLELGHARITLLVNEPDQVPSVALKVKRFLALTAQQGMLDCRVVSCGVTQWESSYDGAYREMESVWRRDDRPTAIFAVSDPGAWAALKWLAEHDVQVPAQVSVLGFENVGPSRFTYPSLSTIAHPLCELAEGAVSKLVAGSSEQTLVPPSLVVRESTGPAP